MPARDLPCGRQLDEVVAYHDGELPPEARAAFEAHLPACEACRRALTAASIALDGFDELVGGGPPPLDVDEAMRLVRKGEEQVRAERARRAAQRRRIWPAVLGAALAAGVAAFLVLRLATPRPAPRVEVARAIEPTPLDEIEAAPSSQPLPPIAAIPVRATRAGATMTIEAPRAPGDRYTAVGLLDASRHPWLVQSGQKPDPACAPACRPLRLEVALGKLPAGPVEAVLVVNPKPIDDVYLSLAMTGPWPPLLEVRAAGKTRIAR